MRASLAHGFGDYGLFLKQGLTFLHKPAHHRLGVLAGLPKLHFRIEPSDVQ
jgi:hypothetical protein